MMLVLVLVLAVVLMLVLLLRVLLRLPAAATVEITSHFGTGGTCGGQPGEHVAGLPVRRTS